MNKLTASTENYDRMYCYLWWEKSNPGECKFGERWVFAGQDPELEIWKRIKSSLGVRKDLAHEGSIVLEAIWDVSDLARKVGRYAKQKRMDDYIRETIGFRKGSTGEIHTLSGPDMAHKVNEYLKRTVQPLPTVDIAQWQYDQAGDVLEAIARGRRTILAELCPRFGKTIWAGVLAIESGARITIVTSYVLTSFASFAKDLSAFEQFRDLEIVDSSRDDYGDRIAAARAQDRQVVVFLSMHGSDRGGVSKRQQRIDYLFGLPDTRLIFVDEADYGAHTRNQTDPFILARGADDVVILMTGTNGERACGNWRIDHYLGTTYLELLQHRAAALA